MSTYQATEPPSDATCSTPGCGGHAEVRLLIPPSGFTADGQDHAQDPSTFDLCWLHWPAIRDASTHNGHQVVDATGDLRSLITDYPEWSIFARDGGRLYPSARL